MTKTKNSHIGSLFQDSLKSERIAEEVNTAIIKAVVAFELRPAMQERGLTKTEMARQLSTSRDQLDRILDPENDTVSLGTLARATELVDRKLTLELT